MFRRNLLLAVAVLVALAGLGAAPTLAQTPKHGGTLIVAQNADISGFDPHTLPDFPTVRMIGLIYETLVTVDADLKIQPALAETWQFSSDGLKLTLNLRKGVTFHSGDPFTSADVKYTLQRLMDPKTKALVSSNFAAVQSVDTPDANTVVLTLSKPNVSIL